MTTVVEQGACRWSAFSALLIALLLGTAGFAEPKTVLDVDPSSMTEPLQLIERARKQFAKVHDYSCDFIKHERIRGELQPQQFMRMKVRNQPFSVHLRWELPHSLAGQEACYVESGNSDKMRVKPCRGLVSLIGWVSLATSDPRAMRDSRHEITEAGIGHLLEQFKRSYAEESLFKRTTVRLATYEYAGRRCRRVETIHPAGTGRFLFHRSVLFFDLENRLPIRVENYDWPRDTGDPAGELVECYSYVNLRTNVGLAESAFNH